MALTTFCEGQVLGERWGSHPRVLALHGWARDRRDFVDALDGIDAIAVDLPGFGASPPPERAIGTEGYARMLAPLVSSFDEPPVVVGHSFGGRVVLHLAVSHPLKALVLSGVPLLKVGPGRRPAARYRLLRRLHRLHLIGHERMEAVRAQYGSADYRAASGVMRDVLVTTVNESYDDLLARIECPVELVWGEDDSASPLSLAQAAVERFPRARLTVVEGGDHFSGLRRPEALRAAIARHLP